MLPSNLGVTFAPTEDQAMLGPKRGQMEGAQQALQVLNLRLPQQLGTGAIAPRGLLEPQGTPTTTPSSAVWQSLLDTLRASGGNVSDLLALFSQGGQSATAAGYNEPPPIFNADVRAPGDWRTYVGGLMAAPSPVATGEVPPESAPVEPWKRTFGIPAT